MIKVKSESEKEKRLEEINNAWAQQNQSHEPKQPTNAPNLKLSWRRKEGDIYEGAQNHKKKKKRPLIMSTANNTDVQPDIFQNPVLIFLNEQFKAHENILLQRKEVDRAFRL